MGVSVGKRIEVRDCIEGTEGRFLVVCCGLSGSWVGFVRW